MRKILLLICILGLSCAAFARIDESSWTALNGLQPGQNIQVVDSSSKKHSGIFMRISDTAISLQVASGEEAIQKDDVRTVKLIANKRRARNTLIGGAVGGGIGAGIGAISGEASDKGCANQPFCLDFFGKGGIRSDRFGGRLRRRCGRRRRRWRLSAFSHRYLQSEIALTNLALIAGCSLEEISNEYLHSSFKSSRASLEKWPLAVITAMLILLCIGC